MTSHPIPPVALAAGGIWTVGVLWIGAALVVVPVFALIPTVMTAFLAPGCVAAAMVARRAWRQARGAGGTTDANADTDAVVLTGTVEQLVLALCIWPAAAVALAGAGPGMILTLGIAFAIASLIRWWGAHRAPVLQAFGFVATFAPTAAVAVWAVLEFAWL